MEGGAPAAEVAGPGDGTAGDAQVKDRKEDGQPAQQPSGSEAPEMPATPLPRDIDWSEHFSFLNSLGGLGGSSDGARGMTAAGLSSSGSRPHSVTQCGLDDAEERVEELKLKNCINTDVQPEVSAGGSSSSGDRSTVIKGLWGNFTQMGRRTGDAASRENTAVSSGNIANSRAVGVSSRENLATGLVNNTVSRNNDVSGKDIPISRGGNVNNEFMMPFLNQQHLLSARPNQSEQQAEREIALKVSSFSNRLLDQIRSKTITPSSGSLGSPFKNSLKGKGVAHQSAQEEIQVQATEKPRVLLEKNPTILTSSTHDSMAKVDPLLFNSGGNVSKSHSEGASLRELINPGRQTLSKFEKMNLFKQILDLVDKCHAQGLTLQHLYPSYFTIPSSGQVKYFGSYATQDLSTSIRQDVAPEDTVNRKRSFGHKSEHEESNGHGNSMLKYQKDGEQGSIAARRLIHTFWTDQRGNNHYEVVDHDVLRQGDSSYTVRERSKFVEPYGNNTSCVQHTSGSGNQRSAFEPRILEESWYRSPEESSQLSGTFPSNIYSLGVLLFELFCCCQTWEVHCSAMSDLRHRILPPNFLSESPKEAGFCLWLLHPDPCLRPKARDILGCDVINEGRDLSLSDQASAAAISEKDTESSLLLSFLSQLKEEKEMQVAKLSADLASLQTDITEVEKRHSRRTGFSLADIDVLQSSSASPGAFASAPQGALLSSLLPSLCKSSIYEEMVMRNLEQLENAYYSMRSAVDKSDTNAIKHPDNEALRVRENFYQLNSDSDAANEQTDSLGCFFDSLCKYARYSRFEVRGILKNADILHPPNVICSLSFDRDEEYFAAAGVSKKIKIFEFDALLNDQVDIHYPLIELPSKSKLSCVCWNNYIKNYLASTDYDGTVQLWDASSGQGFMQFTEHRKRAWSVSFSEVDPTKLASGGDECCVKVWSINQNYSSMVAFLMPCHSLLSEKLH